MPRLAKDGRVVEVWLTATALVNDAGMVYAIATTERECSGGKSDKSDQSDRSDSSDNRSRSTPTPL